MAVKKRKARDSKKRGAKHPKAPAKSVAKKRPMVGKTRSAVSKTLPPAKLAKFERIIRKLQQRALTEMELIRDTSLMNESATDTTTRDSTYAYHMADVGTDADEREKTYLWYTRENNFIQHLENALRRIRNKTYGYCEGCGKRIPDARLEEVPHTRHCVACKTDKH